MSDEGFVDDNFAAQDEELELYEETDALDESEEEEFEEISSEEVDRVVAVLEDLVDTVDSENIKAYLEDAMNNVYFLVYEVEADDQADASTDAA